MFDTDSKRATLINLILSTLPIVGGIVLVSILAHKLDPFLIGMLLMVRQFGSTLANILHAGTPETILYYHATYIDDPSQKSKYLFAGLLIIVMMLLLLVSTYVFFGGQIASVVFPKSENALQYLFSMLFLTFSTVVYYCSHNAIVAERWFVTGNVLEFLSNSGYLILLLCLGLFNDNIPLLIFYYSLLTLLHSLVLIIYLFLKFKTRHVVNNLSFGELKSILSDFIYYGTPRAMAKFLNVLLFSLGPWMLRMQPEEVGYFMIALISLKSVQSSLAPISQVLSVFTPSFNGFEDKQQQGISQLVSFLIYSSVFVTLTMILYGVDVYTLWLGSTEHALEVYKYFKFLIYAVLPFALFSGLRGFITVKWHKPYNLYSLILSFVAFFGFYYLNPWSQNIAVSITVMLYVLGLSAFAVMYSYVCLAINKRLFVVLLLLLPSYMLWLYGASLILGDYSLIAALAMLCIILTYVFVKYIVVTHQETGAVVAQHNDSGMT